MGASVYLHIPYCKSKCHYCDFLSFPPEQGELSPPDYLGCLEAELCLCAKELALEGLLVSTLYIGGGTPTALKDSELERLLAACRSILPLASPEWTVEANPDSVSEEKLALMASMGVCRISVGVQAFDDFLLKLIGRRHSAACAEQAFILCRRYIPSVSLDLMYGLPGQGRDEFLRTLDSVLDWGPDHLSLYGLKLEEGTEIKRKADTGELSLPDEEEVLAMMLEGRKMLKRRGFVHYEISNYARPGHVCRHNLTYWQNRPYLGLGLGAHSFWKGVRYENTADALQYQRTLREGRRPVSGNLQVGRREAMEDTMILGLRLIDGVSFESFSSRFGTDIRDVFHTQLERLSSRGLIKIDGTGVRLSQRGLPLANLVFSEFIGC